MSIQAIPGVPEGALSPSPAQRTFDPLLIPRWYLAMNIGANQAGYASPEAFLAANPRGDATGGALTITGSPGAGDTVAVTLTNKVFPGGAIVMTYTVSGTPTVTVVADGIAQMINNNQSCRAFGINASSLAGVVTITHNGPVGNYTVGSVVATEVGGTTAAAFSSSGVFSGGTGPVVPLSTFNAPYKNNLFSFYFGRPVSIDGGALAAFNTAGLPLG